MLAFQIDALYVTDLTDGTHETDPTGKSTLTQRLRQDGWHFADISKCIFLKNENVVILFKMSLKCISDGQIDNKPALIQKMA